MKGRHDSVFIWQKTRAYFLSSSSYFLNPLHTIFYYQAPVLELRDWCSFGSYSLGCNLHPWTLFSHPLLTTIFILSYSLYSITFFLKYLEQIIFPNWSLTNPIWVFHFQIIFLFSAVYIKIFLNSLHFCWTENVCILPLVLNNLQGIEF